MTTIDNNVQTILANHRATPRERAEQATELIEAHVRAEFNVDPWVPLDMPLEWEHKIPSESSGLILLPEGIDFGSENDEAEKMFLDQGLMVVRGPADQIDEVLVSPHRKDVEAVTLVKPLVLDVPEYDYQPKKPSFLERLRTRRVKEVSESETLPAPPVVSLSTIPAVVKTEEKMVYTLDAAKQAFEAIWEDDPEQQEKFNKFWNTTEREDS